MKRIMIGLTVLCFLQSQARANLLEMLWERIRDTYLPMPTATSGVIEAMPAVTQATLTQIAPQSSGISSGAKVAIALYAGAVTMNICADLYNYLWQDDISTKSPTAQQALQVSQMIETWLLTALLLSSEVALLPKVGMLHALRFLVKEKDIKNAWSLARCALI